MYADRIDAGNQLAERLMHYVREKVVVLAIPRGGLPVAAIVAGTLNAPLDVALIKKLGHPHNREYAIGAVSLNNVVLSNAFGVARNYIRQETDHIRNTLKERYKQYYKKRKPASLEDKTVIIVDDGIATGSTVMATVELVHKQNPQKIVVAIPVAPKLAIDNLKDSPLVDEVICPFTPYNFHAVGQFYEKFYQITDQEAISILEQSGNS